MIKSLKKIAETKWVGNISHDTLDKCLMAINLETLKNGGWYNPVAIQINGLSGLYMINKDGSIHWEARVIKQYDNKFIIEYLTNEAYNIFEKNYIEQMSI